jgi:tRNA pseudouridine13 synthase
MREAHGIERAVGIEYYVSDAGGIGGRLRDEPADFRVREIEAFGAEPLDADPGSYPHLLIRATLRGWDTNDFAGRLSDRLGISRERISWAGTKDKHAITTQLFSVRGVDAGELPEVENAEIEPVGRTGRPILFGDLAGNAFEITVREPEHPERVDAITADLRAFAGGDLGDGEGGDEGRAGGTTVGVPNYFGQQRFGSRRPVTHEVGLALVREGFEAAVLAYVGNPAEREPAATREARAYVEETSDWAGALDRFPDRMGYERAMCHELAGTDPGPADFRRALEAVPANLQQLFVNAAQSALFNRMLSARLERGLPFAEPVAGDVVCFADRSAPAELALPDPGRTQRVTEERLDTVSRHCERGRAFVTAPLVGTDTDLADGEPGEIERGVIEEAGIDPVDFDLPGEFGSAGTRRAVLVRTDLRVDRDPLQFAFALPKGAYATVLLREYLKGDPGRL